MDGALFLAQRFSAILLIPMVVVHLVGIMYAIHGGLTTALILGRTQGSILFGTYYSLFVIVAAIHASIGMRNVLVEWTSMNQRAIAWGMLLLGLFLTVTGLRAVAAVIL